MNQGPFVKFQPGEELKRFEVPHVYKNIKKVEKPEESYQYNNHDILNKFIKGLINKKSDISIPTPNVNKSRSPIQML